MAVPKQRTSRSHTHSRRSANSRIKKVTLSACPQCGEPKRPHYVCPHCGYYRDRQIIEVE